MAPLESKLRVEAPAFCPPPHTKTAPIDVPSTSSGSDEDLGLPDDPWALSTEMCVSPAELEELEEVEGWVNLMAELEGMEQDHLIELSLRHADKGKIAQIKAAVMAKQKNKAAHKHKLAHKA